MTAEKMLWEYAGDILTSPTMARETFALLRSICIFPAVLQYST